MWAVDTVAVWASVPVFSVEDTMAWLALSRMVWVDLLVVDLIACLVEMMVVVEVLVGRHHLMVGDRRSVQVLQQPAMLHKCSRALLGPEIIRNLILNLNILLTQ